MSDKKKTRSQLFHLAAFNEHHRAAISNWRTRHNKVENENVNSELNVSATSADDLVAQITRIYEEHNPQHLPKLPKILNDYEGKEQELLTKLLAKYCTTHQSVPCDESFGSVQVYMTFQINGEIKQPVRFLLYDIKVPLTSANFKSLCASDKVVHIMRTDS